MNKVYILGGAQTDFERNWTKEGKSMIALLREVIEDGLEATGLTYDEITELNKNGRIGCFIGNFCAEYYVNQGHLGALLTEVSPAFYGVPCARYEAACASGSVALEAAITKIRANDYDIAIVIGWELMKTVDAKIGADFLGRAALYEKEGKGVEFPFPKLFGKLVDEILNKYEIDEARLMKNLSKIADINYSNAKRNSKAQTRKWFMDKRQAENRGSQTNPTIGGKLAISDCSQVTDGAAMVVLASKSYVCDRVNYSEIPVVKGWGHRVAPMLFEKKIIDSNNSKYLLPWTRQAIEDAYNVAKLTVEDIDVFETHDCFTSSEYIAISCFGITEPGKEYEAIEDGRIEFEGSSPINPSGGLIGCGHPVGASGVRMFLDIYKQVNNSAGDYQINNVTNGMILNIGGSATTNYAFIIGK